MTASKPSYWNRPGYKGLTPLTIGQLVDISAKKWPDKEALVFVHQEKRLTFGEIKDKADRLAAGLLQLGLSPGDRLAIWGPNSAEWCITKLAAARGGFIIVQLDPAYEKPQLLDGLNKVGVKALVCAQSFKTNNYYEMLRSLVPELDSCAETGVELNCSNVPSLKTLIFMGDCQYRGAYKFHDVLSSAQPKFLQRIQELQTLIQPDDGAVIHYSSGTTGNPKAVLLSHHNIVNNAVYVGKQIEQDKEGARINITMQFCHISGSVIGIISNIIYGATVVISSAVYDGEKVLETVEKERCTHIIATPSPFVEMIRIAKSQGLKFTTLKCAGIGGAPSSQELPLEILRTFNMERICSCYGMTEIGFVAIGQPGDDLEEMSNYVGHMSDDMEFKVVDREGRMVPIGTPGELWVRGYSVMLKYWGDEEQTLKSMGPGGWVKTGDQFILQEHGYGKVVGRIKDVIIRLADKIFPVEMENFFMKHPDVIEAQVLGVPDPKVGEEICVFLRLRDGIELTVEDIINYCKDKIPEYRIPRYIRFVKEFPRTVIGKVKKYELLEMLQKEFNGLL
ncbi:medium-chain acyl-CoA ligase ACSF2, mitochondrial-like [Periplaneta americana]|uniref:medium-chain acyl-CoA ligase ACSF2, mitochondrial-like n=1 Tax=Periplaneta americana TaxID=6978 RepID=UPI0037E91491